MASLNLLLAAPSMPLHALTEPTTGTKQLQQVVPHLWNPISFEPSYFPLGVNRKYGKPAESFSYTLQRSAVKDRSCKDVCEWKPIWQAAANRSIWEGIIALLKRHRCIYVYTVQVAKYTYKHIYVYTNIDTPSLMQQD